MQFAPVRRLEDGALAAAALQLRGRASSSVRTSEELRRAARLMQQQLELDQRTQQFAAHAVARTVAETLPLLVPIDLTSIDDLLDPVESPLHRLMVTVLPDTVLRAPQHALAMVARARAAGRMICVDGVGVSENAITLLSLIEPDVVVTGPELLRRWTDPGTAKVAHVLAAHIERSHATIIAEGVDTERLRVIAVTMGATYGIGALYPAVEDPAELLQENVTALPEAPVWSTPPTDLSTPFAITSEKQVTRRGSKRLLIEMSKSLEAQAASAGAAVILLGTFQKAKYFTPAAAERWRAVADMVGLAGVYGVGLNNVLDGNVQHAPLDPDDPLVEEWNVVVLGPHFAAILSARDRHDNGPDLERTFDFVQSYDRLTVTQTARSILSRFGNAPT